MHLADEPTRRIDLFLQDVGARDVGRQEIRRELHATERQVERLGERGDEQRLREARHADEQRVPARHQRDEHRVDDLALPDHHLGDGAAQALAAVCEESQELGVRWARHGGAG